MSLPPTYLVCMIERPRLTKFRIGEKKSRDTVLL
jgi:hypothetical protein